MKNNIYITNSKEVFDNAKNLNKIDLEWLGNEKNAQLFVACINAMPRPELTVPEKIADFNQAIDIMSKMMFNGNKLMTLFALANKLGII